ncbi:UNKNOWN [Stylonychia lemnae]|uniref:Uncharacterized protein n=1 Tax=Stylonychia lemnae TaxID=5949 RepID=A0A078ALN1_STYLE|nr:UNKNOWN [Stylonychia lemnae]|eukprot:CDW82317.1 UNKNOWN [Stylonychia lemnae]
MKKQGLRHCFKSRIYNQNICNGVDIAISPKTMISNLKIISFQYSDIMRHWSSTYHLKNMRRFMFHQNGFKLKLNLTDQLTTRIDTEINSKGSHRFKQLGYYPITTGYQRQKWIYCLNYKQPEQSRGSPFYFLIKQIQQL